MTGRAHAGRGRRALRGLVVVVLGTALAAVAVVTLRRNPPNTLPTIKPVDGWTVTGIRSRRYDDGSRVLTWSADEVALRHARAGMFAVGFARRLEVRNARVELDLRETSSGATAGSDLGSFLKTIAGGQASTNLLIVGARVNGLSVRAQAPNGEWLEITARHCEASATDRGHVVFRDEVRVRSPSADMAYSMLDYDPRVGRFVDGRPAGLGKPDLAGVNAVLLRLINAARDTDFGSPH